MADEQVIIGVREYGEGMDVCIDKHAQNGRWIIKAWNEAGYNHVEIDAVDLYFALGKIFGGRRQDETCDGCEQLNGRHCMLGANHCTRRAEDCYKPQGRDQWQGW